MKKILYGFHIKNEYIGDIGHGLNEGVTQYLTNKRDSIKNNEKTEGYPILVMETENLVSVIGEEKILGSYFNNTISLKDKIAINNMNFETIINAFDHIRIEEQTILENRIKEGKLVKSILGIYNTEYELIGESSKELNNELIKGIGNIDSIDKFKKVVNIIQRLESQNLGLDRNELYNNLLSITNNLKVKLNNISDIDEILNSSALKDKLEFQEKFENLFIEDKNQACLNIKKIEDSDEDFYDDIYDEQSYSKYVDKFFYPYSNINSCKKNISSISLLLDNYQEFDFDEISVKTIDNSFEFCNIMKTMDDRTFLLFRGSNRLIELKNNEFYIDSDITRTLKISLSNGDLNFYNLKGEKEIYIETEDVDYQKSNLEILEDKVCIYDEKINKFKEINVPSIIFEKDVEKKNLILKDISAIKDRVLQRRIKNNKKQKTQEETLKKYIEIRNGSIGKEEVISSSILNIAKNNNQKARDITQSQVELKANYKKIELPKQEKNCKDQDMSE